MRQSSSPAKADPHRHIRAAHGYFELGLYNEALEELDLVPLQCRMEVDYLLTRFLIHRRLENWEQLVELSRWLLEANPSEPELWITHADALRHAHDLRGATELLDEALLRFPSNGHLLFQMACYRCQGGDIVEARQFLEAAKAVDRIWSKLADVDEDLAPLRA